MEGVGGRLSTTHDNQQKANWAHHFSGHFGMTGKCPKSRLRWLSGPSAYETRPHLGLFCGEGQTKGPRGQKFDQVQSHSAVFRARVTMTSD